MSRRWDKPKSDGPPAQHLGGFLLPNEPPGPALLRTALDLEVPMTELPARLGVSSRSIRRWMPAAEELPAGEARAKHPDRQRLELDAHIAARTDISPGDKVLVGLHAGCVRRKVAFRPGLRMLAKMLGRAVRSIWRQLQRLRELKVLWKWGTMRVDYGCRPRHIYRQVDPRTECPHTDLPTVDMAGSVPCSGGEPSPSQPARARGGRRRRPNKPATAQDVFLRDKSRSVVVDREPGLIGGILNRILGKACKRADEYPSGGAPLWR